MQSPRNPYSMNSTEQQVAWLPFSTSPSTTRKTNDGTHLDAFGRTWWKVFQGNVGSFLLFRDDIDNLGISSRHGVDGRSGGNSDVGVLMLDQDDGEWIE